MTYVCVWEMTHRMSVSIGDIAAYLKKKQGAIM